MYVVPPAAPPRCAAPIVILPMVDEALKVPGNPALSMFDPTDQSLPAAFVNVGSKVMSFKPAVTLVLAVVLLLKQLYAHQLSGVDACQLTPVVNPYMMLLINADLAGAVATEPSMPVPAGVAAPKKVLFATKILVIVVVARSKAVVHPVIRLNCTD